MRRTVLIVEDAQHCASAIEIALLGIPNITVAHAANGREALDFLQGPRSQDLCALVTDLNMPGMDGFELIERVRTVPRFAKIPIVVLSGDPDPATPGRLSRLGADAYFTKPYSPNEVRIKIEELLNAYAP